jgi:hypothetical protein
MDTQAVDPFLASVPAFARFSAIVDDDGYMPLPADWVVGVADVTDSTGAIAAGQYKSVNFAGAAVIAAMGNALSGRTFPFVFGGDGAAFALPGGDAALARAILAQTATLVREEFGLDLRTALVPATAIRAAGLDVKLAFFAASPDVTYAMFSGGGLAWADAEMKAGRFVVPGAHDGVRPDLTGLSCRFAPIASRRGLILSLIARPLPGAEPAAYRDAIRDVTAIVESSPERASPVPPSGPSLAWPPAGLGREARLTHEAGASRPLHWLRVALRVLGIHAVFRLKWPVGGFDPKTYIGELVGNSDYRKYDDGLRMTIDCTPDLADRIEARLAGARTEGILAYGLHRQTSALMTCFTPSVHRRDHVHFVDGGAGGYAAAATQMKASLLS